MVTRHDRLRPLSYNQTDVFLICFSHSPQSFDNVKSKWWLELQQHAAGVPILLVGTKGDLRNDSKTATTLADQGLKMVMLDEANIRAKEICIPRVLSADQGRSEERVR